MVHINSTARKRLAKAVSITTSVATTAWLSGAAFLMPLSGHAAVTINDGDIFRASNDFKVYIAKHVGAKKFKRWFVGPQMFDFYKHLSFAVVKVVDPAVAMSYTESMLTRVDGDQKVWHIGNAVAGASADKKWVSTLAEFTAAGFDWDSVYVINGSEGGWYKDAGTYSGAPAPSPSVSGGPVAGVVSASLATDNPAGSVLAASSQFNPVLKVTFWAPPSGSATISGLTLTKYGLLANSNVSGVSVWDAAGKRHGPVVSSITSDNKVTVGFGTDAVAVAAGASVTLTVAASFGSGATGGTVYFGLAMASAVTANTTVGGAFPLNGNLFTLTSGSLGDVDIDANAVGGNANSTASGNVDVGDKQKEIAKFNFAQANGTEDIQIESVTVYVEGDITEAKDVLNWKLYDPSNNVLASADRAVDRYVTFTLATPYVIAKGLNRTLAVKADFLDGAGRWVLVHIQNDYDVMVRGTGTRAVLLPTDDDGTAFDDERDTTSGYFRMRSGAMTVTKSPGSPSGQLSAGQADALLAKFTLRASGEDMEVRKMDVFVNKTQGETALTGNISVRSEDGSTTYVSISAATGTAIYTNDTSTRFDLATYIQLKSNVDKVVSVYGNVSSAAVSSLTGGLGPDSYQVSVANFYVKRFSSIDFTDLAATAVSGNDLAVVTTAVTVAKNTSFGDSTVPPSLPGAKIGSFNVQGGTSEDSRISSVKLDFVGTDDATTVSNMVLKVGGVQQGTAVGTPTLTGNTYSVSINVPKNTPVAIDVFGDVKSDAAGTARLTIPTSGLTVIGLSTSNSITPPTSAEVQLQLVTFAAGTLKITKDSSSPVEQILTPANGVLVGHWKFEAKNENLLLAKVTFTVRAGDGGSGTTQSGNFGTLYLKDGSTTLATGSIVSNDVVFSGLNLTIPASGSKVLSVYSDLTGSGTQSPGTLAVWTIKSDTTPTDIDVTGSAGQLGTSDIDGTTDTSAPDTTFATSTRFLYHNSKPVIAAASNTPTGAKTPQASQDVFIFTVTNSGTRDMRIGALSVTVSTAGGAVTGSVSDFDLYDGTQKIADMSLTGSVGTADAMGTASSTLLGAHVGNDVSSYFDNFNISAGSAKTLTVKATTTSIRTGVASGSSVTLSARVAGTTGAASGAAWNTGDFQFFYTQVFQSAESGPYFVSDSYPVNGGTLTY